MSDFTPFTGLIKDTPDPRDFQYKDVFGAASPEPFNWEKGYNAYEDLKLPIIVQDQGSSSSCTCQAIKAYVRRWLFKLSDGKEDIEHSAHDSYSKIYLPQGGAQFRDAISVAANDGFGRESVCPSYENGKPPTETFMRSFVSDPLAKTFDKFTYRSIPGLTNDIEIFAKAIELNLGVMGGFLGTNGGWCRPDIRSPLPNETIWGHAVDLCAAGILDIDVGNLKAGTKCVFTPNSWGGRYTITAGRWKGLQAIPIDYFVAGSQTADGFVPGFYVYPSWVLVPDTQLTINQKVMDEIKRLEGEIVFNAEGSGEFALVKDGKKLVIAQERAGLAALMKLCKPVKKDVWGTMPSDRF